MIEAKPTSTQLRPRSGLRENSPASRSRAVARPLGTALVREFSRERPPSRSGYCPSLARMSMLASLSALLLALASPNAFPQEPTPAPSPMVSPQQNLKVPTVAVDYRADVNQALPSLSRVGVDTSDQQPMTLREAIALALANNKDIEVARLLHAGSWV